MPFRAKAKTDAVPATGSPVTTGSIVPAEPAPDAKPKN